MMVKIKKMKKLEYIEINKANQKAQYISYQFLSSFTFLDGN